MAKYRPHAWPEVEITKERGRAAAQAPRANLSPHNFNAAGISGGTCARQNNEALIRKKAPLREALARGIAPLKQRLSNPPLQRPVSCPSAIVRGASTPLRRSLPAGAPLGRSLAQERKGTWWLTCSGTRWLRPVLRTALRIFCTRAAVACSANTRPCQRQSALESCPHLPPQLAALPPARRPDPASNGQRLRAAKACHTFVKPRPALFARDIAILVPVATLQPLSLAGCGGTPNSASLIVRGAQLQGMRETNLNQQHWSRASLLVTLS
ncbi:hypothetical protein TARUN_474 [Trichoderma arundinaceum]|uniref:Uncharacterized protein n=1 Tax=Trichoderma arundinaceum TaxID=490622 RepID=A0A395P064_TRIAR|nr:hypothetical protein TARUN_474 [Trichoderma arundinaceum]